MQDGQVGVIISSECCHLYTCTYVYTVLYCLLTLDMPLLLMRFVNDPRPVPLVAAVTLLGGRWWPLCACACGGSSLSRYCSCSPCVYACMLVVKDSVRPFSAAWQF